MNKLHKKIYRLDQNIKKRRALSRYQYQQAKTKLKDKLTSPVAFGVAFLVGVLLGRHKKAEKKLVEKPVLNKQRNLLSPIFSILYLVTEIPKALSLIKQAEGALKKKAMRKKSSKPSRHR